MSSPAERLAAAKGELETHYNSISSLTKRSSLEAPSARERLAAARDQLEAAFNGFVKRSQPSASERLAAAKNALETSYGPTGLIKRDGVSAAERLSAAKLDLESSFPSPASLLKRGSLSAADRLAAAKQGLEDTVGSAASALIKRAGDEKDEPVQGKPEMPVSNFQKTVVPIVIGLVLLILFGGVAGFIVYRRRQKNKATESASHRRKHLDIEDDGADEDFGYELPQSQRVQDVGFGGSGASVHTGRKRTSSLKGAHVQAKRDEPREHNSKEFV